MKTTIDLKHNIPDFVLNERDRSFDSGAFAIKSFIEMKRKEEGNFKKCLIQKSYTEYCQNTRKPKHLTASISYNYKP